MRSVENQIQNVSNLKKIVHAEFEFGANFFINTYFLIQKDIVTAEFRDVKIRVFNSQMVQSYKRKTVDSIRKVKIIKLHRRMGYIGYVAYNVFAQSEQNADCSKIN